MFLILDVCSLRPSTEIDPSSSLSILASVFKWHLELRPWFILSEFKFIVTDKKRIHSSHSYNEAMQLCNVKRQKVKSYSVKDGVCPFAPQQPECHPAMTVESRRVTQRFM